MVYKDNTICFSFNLLLEIKRNFVKMIIMINDKNEKLFLYQVLIFINLCAHQIVEIGTILVLRSINEMENVIWKH